MTRLTQGKALCELWRLLKEKIYYLNDVFALRRKKQMKWNDDQMGEASMFHNEAETELMRSVKNYNLI